MSDITTSINTADNAISAGGSGMTFSSANPAKMEVIVAALASSVPLSREHSSADDSLYQIVSGTVSKTLVDEDGIKITGTSASASALQASASGSEVTLVATAKGHSGIAVDSQGHIALWTSSESAAAANINGSQIAANGQARTYIIADPKNGSQIYTEVSNQTAAANGDPSKPGYDSQGSGSQTKGSGDIAAGVAFDLHPLVNIGMTTVNGQSITAVSYDNSYSIVSGVAGNGMGTGVAIAGANDYAYASSYGDAGFSSATSQTGSLSMVSGTTTPGFASGSSYNYDSAYAYAYDMAKDGGTSSSTNYSMVSSFASATDTKGFSYGYAYEYIYTYASGYTYKDGNMSFGTATDIGSSSATQYSSTVRSRFIHTNNTTDTFVIDDDSAGYSVTPMAGGYAQVWQGSSYIGMVYNYESIMFRDGQFLNDGNNTWKFEERKVFDPKAPLTLDGDDKNNLVVGGQGDDTLTGGAGNDTFVGGSGNDSIDGGTGLNTLDYSGDKEGVSVNLTAGTATGAVTGTDSFKNIAIAIGGTGDDIIIASDKTSSGLIGNAGNDILIGGIHDDVIVGGDGDDGLYGGGGIDLIDGGTGTDVLLFDRARATYAVTKTSDGTGLVIKGAEGTVTAYNVEAIRFMDQDIAAADALKVETIAPAKAVATPAPSTATAPTEMVMAVAVPAEAPKVEVVPTETAMPVAAPVAAPKVEVVPTETAMPVAAPVAAPVEKTFTNVAGTQWVSGDSGQDVFVVGASHEGYHADRTQDGTGIVLWKGSDFDILKGIDTIRFTDKAFTAKSDGAFDLYESVKKGAETIYTDTADTQWIKGTTAQDVFVIKGNSADYSANRTQDGQGVVVYNGTKFDILNGVDVLRFNDKDVRADANGQFQIHAVAGNGGETLFQNAAGTQWINGTGNKDVFVVGASSEGYGYSKTKDGSGIVVWHGNDFDILSGIETIRFQDHDILVSDIH